LVFLVILILDFVVATAAAAAAADGGVSVSLLQILHLLPHSTKAASNVSKVHCSICSQ
jgi:hypothetical protein